MSLKIQLTATLIGLSITLAGCVTATRPVESITAEITIPERWNAAESVRYTSDVATNDMWWESYKDPSLNAVVERALQRNEDLAISITRVRQARTELKLLNTVLIPEVATSFYGSIAKPLNHNDPSDRSYSSELDVGYELDLWGKYDSAIDGAEWAVRANEYDKRAAALSIVASVIESYWAIGLAKDKIAAQRENIERAETVLKLSLAREEQGVGSSADVNRATVDFAEQQAGMVHLQLQLSTARLNLESLLNDQAGESERYEPHGLSSPSTIPHIVLQRPAAVLARRPDLQSAEAKLRQAYANAEVKRKSFYPTILLGGSVVGGNSRTFGDVLGNPIGTLGAQLTLPFLQFRKNRYAVLKEQQKYEEVGQEFIYKFHKAIMEVENAVETEHRTRSQLTWRNQASSRARQVELSVERRYQAGQDNLQVLLDARQAARNADMARKDLEYQLLLATLRVMQAMAGE
ncbi:TolC family protein [Pandoraea sp. NPDC090278]|uniref:TolC family protein n=1 Tax=Pandoraea sp. NPDC090278 TaxID=3364391 RepID=UPI00383AF859